MANELFNEFKNLNSSYQDIVDNNFENQLNFYKKLLLNLKTVKEIELFKLLMLNYMVTSNAVTDEQIFIMFMCFEYYFGQYFCHNFNHMKTGQFAIGFLLENSGFVSQSKCNWIGKRAWKNKDDVEFVLNNVPFRIWNNCKSFVNSITDEQYNYYENQENYNVHKACDKYNEKCDVIDKYYSILNDKYNIEELYFNYYEDYEDIENYIDDNEQLTKIIKSLIKYNSTKYFANIDILLEDIDKYIKENNAIIDDIYISNMLQTIEIDSISTLIKIDIEYTLKFLNIYNFSIDKVELIFNCINSDTDFALLDVTEEQQENVEELISNYINNINKDTILEDSSCKNYSEKKKIIENFCTYHSDLNTSGILSSLRNNLNYSDLVENNIIITELVNILSK